MAKTTYIVTAPNGSVFTRKSERVYTHAVLVQPCYEEQVKSADTVWEVDKSNFRYSQKIVESNGTLHARQVYREEQRAEVERANAERLEKSRAEVETFKTADAYAADCRARRVAAINERKKAGGFDVWIVEGFCGRPDLAAKLAAKVHHHYHNAKIVAVTTK